MNHSLLSDSVPFQVMEVYLEAVTVCSPKTNGHEVFAGKILAAHVADLVQSPRDRAVGG
jgi:hypothetical protein